MCGFRAVLWPFERWKEVADVLAAWGQSKAILVVTVAAVSGSLVVEHAVMQPVKIRQGRSYVYGERGEMSVHTMLDQAITFQEQLTYNVFKTFISLSNQRYHEGLKSCQTA